MHRLNKEKGVILIFVLIVMVALVGIALAFWSMISSDMKITGAGLADMKAFYIAEAGLAKARWALIKDAQSIPWQETDTAFGGGTYTVTADYSDPPTNQYVTITSDGYVPDSTNIVAQRQVEESNITIASGMNLSLASNGTAASSSGHQGQNLPGDAIDGKTNTKWASSIKATSWLALDYGSAQTVSTVTASGSKINSIVVQYSNNGASWTAVSSPSGAMPGTQTFTPVTTRYLRLNITSGKNAKAQVKEFESYTGTGGEPTLGQGKFSTSL